MNLAFFLFFRFHFPQSCVSHISVNYIFSIMTSNFHDLFFFPSLSLCEEDTRNRNSITFRLETIKFQVKYGTRKHFSVNILCKLTIKCANAHFTDKGKIYVYVDTTEKVIKYFSFRENFRLNRLLRSDYFRAHNCPRSPKTILSSPRYHKACSSGHKTINEVNPKN